MGPRGRSGRSGGWGDDPTLPETQRDSTAQVIVAEPLEAGGEIVDYEEEAEERASFSVRLDAWRRHYLPLPDEVVNEYLGEDEYVIHSDHPSFRAFLFKNAIQVVGVGVVGLAFLIFLRGGFDWITVLIFLALQLGLAALAVQRLSDRYTTYIITNLRLIRLSGVFGRKLASIPWTRMTGLGYRQKPMGRILGYATIFIESANEESGLREFSDINDPAAFHQKILDMVSSKSGQSTKDQAPPATRGVRKSFRQRRRERRALAIERARRAAHDGGLAPSKPEVSEPVPTVTPDTAGVYEALSTTDSGARPATGQPLGRRQGSAGGRVSTGSPTATPTSRPGPPPPGASAGAGRTASGPRSGGAGRAAGTTPPPPPPPPPSSRSTGEGGVGRRRPGAAAGGATAGSAAGGRRSNRLWPGADTATPAGRPTAPPGPTRPVRPPRAGAQTPPRPTPPPPPPAPPPPSPPAGHDDASDAGTQAPQPRRWRSGWIWARRQPEVPREARRTSRRQPGEGTVSARDALGSIRRGQRPARPVRRVRLPTFARRSRPTFPESRQLPAAPEDRHDDSGGSSGDDDASE